MADVAADFERYWSSESARPLATVLPRSIRPADLDATCAQVRRNPATGDYLEAIRQSGFVRDLLAGTLELEWAPVEMLSDDPAKALGRGSEQDQLWSRLRARLGQPIRELQLISAYFVPRAKGVRDLAALVRQGAAVTVLTNSLEATDVAAVHSGYSRRRKPLLLAGVSLFEMKRHGAPSSGRGRWHSGSSHTSLHAKTFTIDRTRIFIGSFNFDPRSARLNTEMGLLIESPALATRVTEGIASRIRARAYQVRLDPRGNLEWLEQSEPTNRVYDREPGSTLWQRAAIALLARLPIEWLL